ncbi:MAG: ADYC domain-containing protein [Kofleriaceae bacterium]
MRIASLLIVVAACTDVEIGAPDLPEPAPEPSGTEQQKPPPPGEEEQGRFLLGEGTDLLGGGKANSHISFRRQLTAVPPNAVTVTRVRPDPTTGLLVGFAGGSNTPVIAGTDPEFLGMELASSDGSVKLRIDGFSTNARYLLTVISDPAKPSYCANGDGAMVVAGRWTTSGLHESDAAEFTFGCEDGVIRKCFTWGYHPPEGEANPDTPTDPWTAHQACTRMARADYCSIGETHTMDETSIVIRDFYRNVGEPDIDLVPLQRPTTDPAPPDQYWFEAIWRGGDKPVLCMEKERWKSLPLGGPCPGIIDDPRTVAGAHYCSELSDTTDAILWNSSKVGQLYLNRWTRGTEELVTVRGMPGGLGRPAVVPYGGYVFQEQLGLLMRNPPGSLKIGTQLLPVDMQQHTVANTVVDRTLGLHNVLPTAHTTVNLEGYVYFDKLEDPTRLELKLYQNGTDFVTSTVAPTGSFTFVRSLGFIDRDPQ